MSSINQKSGFTVIFTLNKKLRLSWVSWPTKNIKTKPPRELLCEGPHTKHPVRYFPGQNEMNRGKKMGSIPGMDACQSTNFKSLLSFPCSTCTTEKTQINTVSILSCQFAKSKWWKHLRKFRTRLGPHDFSELEWLQYSLGLAWVGVSHRHNLNLKIQNEAHAIGLHNLDRRAGTVLWPSQWLLILSKEIYNTGTFLICESQWNSLEGLLNC